jgi:hypothetical protein
MTRLLYQWLLWLHPPRFRREFSGEMLWIFDNSAASEGPVRLLFDAVVSLGRQWLLRSGCWKIAAALAGGLMQVALGGLAVQMIGYRRVSLHSAATPITATVDDLVRITVFLLPAVILSVVLLALWIRGFTHKRMHGVR